jgi:hypothetical protein
MTEQEDATFLRRRNRFRQLGHGEEEANELAYKMLVRDREQVDLRICLECKGMVGRNCVFIKDKYGKPTQQAIFILQRCDHFQLKGKQ